MGSLHKKILLLLFLAFAIAYPQQSNLLKRSGSKAPVYIKCKSAGKVALTFDDGPSTSYTSKALDILKKENIKATFFINGLNYSDLVNDKKARDLVLRAYNEGHIIGSHTFYHKDLFTALSDGSFEENIVKLRDVIKNIIGREPAFFRPPSGNGGYTKEYCTENGIYYDERTETVRKQLAKYNAKIIMWNADTADWKYKGNYQASLNEFDISFKRYGSSPQSSSFITLLHDVHQYSIETILPKLISHVKKAGYEFVSMSECIGESAYLDGKSESKTTKQHTATTKKHTTKLAVVTQQPNNPSNQQSQSQVQPQPVTTTIPVPLQSGMTTTQNLSQLPTSAVPSQLPTPISQQLPQPTNSVIPGSDVFNDIKNDISGGETLSVSKIFLAFSLVLVLLGF